MASVSKGMARDDPLTLRNTLDVPVDPVRMVVPVKTVNDVSTGSCGACVPEVIESAPVQPPAVPATEFVPVNAT